MKQARYHDMLGSNIMQFVRRSGCKTLDDMVARGRERDIYLDGEEEEARLGSEF